MTESDPSPDPRPPGEPADAHPRTDGPRDDCFGPPDAPVECFCLHCGHIYMSDLLLAIDVDGTTHYACPVKGCGGMGYKFDIFPVNDDDDPDGGWVEFDDETDIDEDEEDADLAETESFDQPFDAEGEIPFDPPREWSPEDDADEDGAMEEEEPRYFTRDEYDELKSAGEYDRRAEEIRQWWRQCEAERKRDTGTVGDTSFREDDIPF
jgi:hypothetical protein